MPPVRGGRASKACDLCRKYKTRCYASDDETSTCLRCKALAQPCSLEASSVRAPNSGPSTRHRSKQHHTTTAVDSIAQVETSSVDSRLDRLETTVGSLVNRLDSIIDKIPQTPNHPSPVQRTSRPFRSSNRNPAPVALIRDAAANAGIQSPSSQIHTEPDVISTGLVLPSTALTLTQIFHFHYGRWVRFPEELSADALLSDVRRSPLLLSSIFLIAVRHTTQELADKLAPRLFQETKQLLAVSLLEVPQSIEFFQAALILSLWSTTIGQVPLSIDSWLVTGYALQQALIHPDFAAVLRPEQEVPDPISHVNAWCIWNHLCVAHLQYCVGMRRKAILDMDQVEKCIRLVECEDVNNFEARMAAEVKLYWIIYERCSASDPDLAETEMALENWQKQWSMLFGQPRSQFLQMGYHFAHLLAYYQSLKSPRAVMGDLILSEMVSRAKRIINLAIGTTDERTRHLTDHIYHVVTFSALTLCRLVHTYEPQLQASNQDIADLDGLVVKFINWSRTIGLPCHASHILSDVVSAQFRELRPDFQAAEAGFTLGEYGTNNDDQAPANMDNMFLYPFFIESELHNLEGTTNWPRWT